MEKKEKNQRSEALCADFMGYLGLNLVFTLIWAIESHGFFWPLWSMGLWGGLLWAQYNRLSWAPKPGVTLPLFKAFPALQKILRCFQNAQECWGGGIIKKDSRDPPL